MERRAGFAELIRELPPLPRKYGLLYLVVQLGSLARSDVPRLAQQLEHDVKEGFPRSLLETADAAQVTDHANGYHDDPVLTQVALRYTEEEFTRGYSLDPRSPGERLRTLADTRAGSGPERPLLKELYSLENLGFLFREEVPPKGPADKGDEVFYPTHAASSLAKAVRIVYANRKLKGRRVVLGQFELSVVIPPIP